MGNICFDTLNEESYRRVLKSEGAGPRRFGPPPPSVSGSPLQTSSKVDTKPNTVRLDSQASVLAGSQTATRDARRTRGDGRADEPCQIQRTHELPLNR
ncbi:hypothetical protein RB195_002888 [Necator americanus]|uniref:Uncharacterized protein n=1 Tax=Necator americanus TaxID=51031 RepID=A0ABR1DL52_NECAM